MKNDIIKEANYILTTNKTIRASALDLGLSKSVLHRHLSQDLKKYDYELYLKVKKIFLEHNKVKHIMGGLANKKRFEKV